MRFCVKSRFPCEDVRAVAPAVLRHRVLLNFQAEAEKVDSDQVIKRLIETVPEPKSGCSHKKHDLAQAQQQIQEQPAAPVAAAPVTTPARFLDPELLARKFARTARARGGRRLHVKGLPFPIHRLLDRVHRVSSIQSRRRLALSRLAITRSHRSLLHQEVSRATRTRSVTCSSTRAPQ